MAGSLTPDPFVTMQGLVFTERLELRPLSAPSMQALCDGRLGDFAEMEGVRLPEGWESPPPWWLRSRVTAVTAVPGLAPWVPRAMVRKADSQLIGNMGFHEPPGLHRLEKEVPGIVELGYGVAPEFRRQGYAFEGVGGLIRWAHAAHGVRDFQLSIDPGNTPSHQLALKLGFNRQGEYVHPEWGRMDLYRLRMA